MGTLRDALGREVPLRPRAVVGRSPVCAVVFDGPRVSREHAVITWNGVEWDLRDLGGPNGTWVRGRRLESGVHAALTTGAEVGLGGPDTTFVLAAADPPQPLASSPDGHVLSGFGQILELPTDTEGHAVVLPASDGTWTLDDGGAVRAVRHGEELEVGGVVWRLSLPDLLPSTFAQESTFVGFRAAVSRDEERVHVRVHEGERVVDLGERGHHYLLLTLARLRLADAQRAGLPVAEHGWVHRLELESMLRVDGNYAKVLVHRARRQAAEGGLACAPWLVERRLLSGQLRLGVADIEISALAT